MTPVDNKLAVAFDHSEVLANKLRHDIPTYRLVDLKSLLCKAMFALCILLWAICRPTDKGHGLYTMYQPNFMRQGIKESPNNPKNYTPMSTREAISEISEHIKLFVFF